MFRFSLYAIVLLAMLSASGAAQSENKTMNDKDPAATVIAMERAALDKSDKGDVSGFLDISDDDIVYFDPGLEKPIHGMKALREYYKTYPQSEGAGEMFNVKAQVLGDVVVLTFNYTYRYEGGKKANHWNSTEVYHRTPAGWRIVQTHWSFIRPVLAKTE